MAANVRGFGDLNNQNGQNNQANNYQNINNQNINDSIPFSSNIQSDRAPLDETIPYTLKLVCCPSIKLISLSTILCALMCAIYIFCCTQGINTEDKNRNILEVNVLILIKYGAMQDILLKKG